MPSQPDSGLAERLASVRADIAAAARAAGRVDADITLIVVTKFQSAELVRDLAALGVSDVGENRHPEARDKKLECDDLALTWHFIGQLQSNKAKAVALYADAVHSVDRASLVDALAAAQRPLDVFIQVNLTDDPNRGGVDPREIEPLAEKVLAQPSLSLRGLMAVAGLDAEPRAEFARVRGYSERLIRVAPDASSLSMGMSHDFADALAEGATHLRIGTAITGKRSLTP